MHSTDTINQKLFETSLDLIVVVDPKGCLIRVSPSAESIVGFRPDEMVGHNAAEFLYPEDLESTRNEMRLARRGQSTRNFDSRYIHKRGHVIALSWTGVWSEEVQQHFFIGRDMSERIKLEEQLRQAQKMESLGNLTGGLSHDFNNLLGIVIGNLDLLKSRLGNDPESMELVDEALEASLRGADLNQSLLAFARRQPLQPKQVELAELVGGMTKLLARALSEEVEVVVSSQPDLWPVVVDPAQLESALTNLAVNARDAMPNGGRLSIRTRNAPIGVEDSEMAELPPGDYVALEVSDSGIGMAPEIIARAFEPFYTTKGVGKGTGLGLSMVFGFVKQSGGHIKVYSEVGVGTTFRLFLPRGDTGGAELASQPVPAPEGGRETILAVEDNEGLRRILVKQLTELGYEVLQAADASDALEVLGTERKIDLMLTDIVMPGGVNGWELARRAGNLRPGLKLLFTSGFPEASLGAKEPIPEGVSLSCRNRTARRSLRRRCGQPWLPSLFSTGTALPSSRGSAQPSYMPLCRSGRVIRHPPARRPPARRCRAGKIGPATRSAPPPRRRGRGLAPASARARSRSGPGRRS